MRRDLAFQARLPDRGPEGFLDRLHRFAVPLDEVVPSDAEAVPAAEVGEEPPGDARRRRRLAPAEPADRLPVEIPFSRSTQARPSRSTGEAAAIEPAREPV
jgi:hypothetical protein